MEHDEKLIKALGNTFKKNVGQVIKRFRKKKNITQEALAEKLSLCQTEIGRYEKGQVNITAETMAAISVILDFPLNEYTKEMPPNWHIGHDRFSMDDIFRKLIEVLEAAALGVPISMDEMPAKSVKKSICEDFILDTESMGRIMIEYKKTSRKVIEDFIAETKDMDMDAEAEFLETHLSISSPTKIWLLTAVFDMIRQSPEIVFEDNRAFNPVLRAVLNYIVHTDEASTARRLQEYKKRLEWLAIKRIEDEISGTHSH